MSYQGAKGAAGVYQTIINQMPPHSVFVEAFAGSGTIYRKKRPARRSVLIDKTLHAIEDLDGSSSTLEIIQGCGIAYLEQWSGPDNALVFADPPYVMSSRKSTRDLYAHELTDVDHLRLLKALRSLPCMVMVCGYRSELYDDALSGWRRISYQGMTRGGVATEYLWMNYPEPEVLHDISYIGDNYRDRVTIKRRANRWKNRFAKYQATERCAMLHAILEDPDTASSLSALLDSGIVKSDVDRSTPKLTLCAGMNGPNSFYERKENKG